GSQGLYDPFFQCGDETPYVWAATSQIDHDIGYALSRPVIGELASATAFVDGKTSVDNVGVVRAGAGGVERRGVPRHHQAPPPPPPRAGRPPRPRRRRPPLRERGRT